MLRAIQLITVNEYGLEDALATVKLQAGFKLESVTFGYMPSPTVTATSTITRVVIVNAQPLRPRRTNQGIATRAARVA